VDYISSTTPTTPATGTNTGVVTGPSSMGYELRRLLQQYGVSTPTMAPYTGTSAADAAAYNSYASDYQNRLANTNMYNQAQFNTTGVNFPAFPSYYGAQNAVMSPTPMVPTPMAQVPMVQAPMAQAPVASSPAAAGSGSPAPMAGNKPNMKEFMDATGADFQTASEMLYGVVGSNTDTRDWGAIMSSGNPVTAAAQATGQMYNNPASTAFNLGRSTTDIKLQGSDPTKEALRYDNPTGQAGIIQTPQGFALVSADGIALRGGYGTLEQAQQAGRMFGIGPAQNYAQGGSVKGYRPGGPVDMLYGGAGNAMMMGGAEEDTLTTPPPIDPNAALEAMLNRYVPPTVTSEQIAAAAERRAAEQKAFEDILRSQLQGSDSEPMSKAEKYFRLAAAFGAPTKTGHFAENLGLVGEEMSSQLAAKAQREREAREKRLGVDLEIQKMRMGTAGEEYDALQGLQSEEAKYRRDVAKELLKEQIAAEKAGYTQVTGAELGLTGEDAGKMFNVSPDGQVTAIGGAGTTVNVDTGAANKLDEEFAKLDAKSLAEVSTTGMQAIRNIGRIDHLETLLASSPQGMEGAIKLAAGDFGINTEGLDSAQAARAVISSLVPEQRAPGSGPMTDSDAILFKQALPRIINQPGGNEMILNTVRAIAQYDAEGAAIVQRFRAKEINSVEAFELLQARENPLANFRVPGATEGDGGGSTFRTWNPETKELE
jgi:hypothetical protein